MAREPPASRRISIGARAGSLVTGIWLGNDDGEPTKKASGGNLPVEIWKTYMTVALKGQTPVPLPGLNRWRKAPETTASVASAPSPAGVLGQLFGDPSTPAPGATAARRPPTRGSDDRNFIEKLFGVGE